MYNYTKRNAEELLMITAEADINERIFGGGSEVSYPEANQTLRIPRNNFPSFVEIAPGGIHIAEFADPQRKDSKSVYYSRIPSHECISNMFQVSMDRVENTGWYWGRISKTEATSALEQADAGTFLLRDSSDSRYYFSLSVRLQTNILNIRVLFSYGKFMFDCFETRLCEIPKFDCVVKLICYYVAVSQNKEDKRKVLARSEVGDSEIKLEKPLFKKVPTLQHLCRRVVNRTITKEEQSQLPLPNTVGKFMRDYPYSL